MPNVGLYVSKEKEEIFQRAKIKYGNKLSQYIFDLIERDMLRKENADASIVTDADISKLAHGLYDVYFSDIEREYTSDSDFLASNSNPSSAIMARFTQVYATSPKLYYEVMQLFIAKHPTIGRVAHIEIPDGVKVAQL